MKNIFKKLKADPRKAVGTIFFSVGVFCCVAALLILGRRAALIWAMDHLAEEAACFGGWVSQVKMDKMDMVYFPGCTPQILPDRKYISTGLGFKHGDSIGVYYDRQNWEGRMVVDLIDYEGKPTVFRVCTRIILVGICLCDIGAIILLMGKVRRRRIVRSICNISVGMLLCLSALLLSGVRDMRIEAIENQNRSWILYREVISVHDGRLLVSTNPQYEYEFVSTGLPIKPLDRVKIYYDRSDPERRKVVDLLDRNGNPVILKVTPWLRLGGALFSAVGVIFLLKFKEKGIVEQSTANQINEE